jgi:single-strand DNA-binding protein
VSNINLAAISGNLTRDPELRTTGSGYPVGNLGVAVNRRRKDKDTQEYVEETSFIDVTVWGAFAELVARKLRKGDLVFVSGRLEQSTWEAQDGSKRSKVEIVADQIDGQGLYRSKDEEHEPATSDNGGGAQQQFVPAATAGAADDDIPF